MQVHTLFVCMCFATVVFAKPNIARNMATNVTGIVSQPQNIKVPKLPEIDLWKWNGRIKMVITTLASLIPVAIPVGPIPIGVPVGGIISVLITVFWPTGTRTCPKCPTIPDIWDSMRPMVEGLIDMKIMDQVREERSAQLQGISEILKQYAHAKKHEKRMLLTSVLSECAMLRSEIVCSSSSHHLLPVLISLGVIHLTMLRERYLYGKYIYDEDNTVVWKKELDETTLQYTVELRDGHSRWMHWRKSMIVTKTSNTMKYKLTPPFFYWICKGYTFDKLTKERVTFEKANCENKDYYKSDTIGEKDRMYNTAATAFMELYQMAFGFQLFSSEAPLFPDVPPCNHAMVELGPYRLSDRYRIINATGDWEDVSVIKGVVIRQGDQIDGIQFEYYDHKGRFVGNPRGGRYNHFSINVNKTEVYSIIGMEIGADIKIFFDKISVVLFPDKRFHVKQDKGFPINTKYQGRWKAGRKLMAPRNFKLIEMALSKGVDIYWNFSLAQVSLRFAHILHDKCNLDEIPESSRTYHDDVCVN